MSGYKGHLAGGLIAFACLLYVLKNHNPSACTALEWLSFTLAGSLFPDIDVKSKGQKWLYWLLFILFVCLFICEFYFLLSLFGIISLIPMMVKHRGLFHKLWFILTLPTGVLLGVSIVAPLHLTSATFDMLFFYAGAISHLWLDLGLRRMIRW